VETWFLESEEAMRSVVWRENLFPYIRGGHCAGWSGMETFILLSSEGNAFDGVAWNRGSFYPLKAMRSVKGREMWFLVSADGNELRGLTCKRVSSYPQRLLRSVGRRGKVVP